MVVVDKVISLDDGFMNQYLVAENHSALALCHVAFEALDPRFSTQVCKMHENDLLDDDISTPFDCVACFYVLRHAEKCDNMTIKITDCAMDDKLLKELTDILSNANGKLQVLTLSLRRTKLSDKDVADLFKRALDHLFLSKNNLTDIMSSPFMHTSCTSLELSHNPLGVSGIQSLETAIRAGVLVNMRYLFLSNTLTDDADVNGALLTTLLQSIAFHCSGVELLDLSSNNLGLPGLCSVVKNILEWYCIIM